MYAHAHTHTQMVSLYLDPQGEKVFSKSVASLSHQATGADNHRLSSNDHTVESLQTRVKELELELSKYKNTQMFDSEPMSKKISKVSFSQDQNGQIEEYLPSNGAMNKRTAENDNEHATSEL